MLRRLLLLPLLSPLLAVLLIAALNPRPSVSLRLLTWRAPALPLGAWIALAGAGGAALSAGGTALALRQGTGLPLRRTSRRGMGAETQPEWWEMEEPLRWPSGERAWREPERTEPPRPEAAWQAPPAGWDAAGGSRAPGEPAPTVSVPFRVLRRGTAAEPATATAASRRAQTAEPIAEPVAAGDDWDALASDDW